MTRSDCRTLIKERNRIIGDCLSLQTRLDAPNTATRSAPCLFGSETAEESTLAVEPWAGQGQEVLRMTVMIEN